MLNGSDAISFTLGLSFGNGRNELKRKFNGQGTAIPVGCKRMKRKVNYCHTITNASKLSNGMRDVEQRPNLI